MADLLDRSSLDALVPRLRRYARAATGDPAQADACTERALATVLTVSPPQQCTRTTFYRALYRALREEAPRGSPPAPITEAELVADSVRALAPASRHALLLERLEGLGADEIAAVTDLSTAEVARCVDAAMAELRHRLLGSVLIVEDNFLVAEHLAGVMETLGHNVTAVAATAEEAIAAAERRPPDVVLADVELGGAESGIDAIAAIRAREHVPAVYVTAFPERVMAADQAEPTLVVTKPFDERRLKVAMAAALRPEAPVTRRAARA
ncbi:MAG: response regulator [Alphaproteobacteria bacterium]|nr:response regulator [Alphaproteobacteria bacterium]